MSRVSARRRLAGRRRAAVLVALAGSVALGGTTIAWRTFGAPVSSPANEAPADQIGVAAAQVAGPLDRADVGDAVGDTAYSFSDLVGVVAETSTDGTVHLRVVVDEWTDPDSDDWRFGATRVTWEIDTNADGRPDASARLAADESGPKAGVRGVDGARRCLAEPLADAASRTYGVRFEARCLGHPESFRVRSSFEYDDVVFDLTGADLAPDGGWSDAVAGPADDTMRIAGAAGATERARRCSIGC